MRVVLLAGFAATVSLSARLATAESKSDEPRETRVVSPYGRTQLKWFLADGGPRTLAHDDTSGSRLAKLSELDLLTQVTVIDHEIHRFGVHIGGRDLTGVAARLEDVKTSPDDAVPATLTPWVNVVREASTGVERLTLAIAERDMLDGWTGAGVFKKTVRKPVRVQRDYVFESATEHVRVAPRMVKSDADGGEGSGELVVITTRGTGVFKGHELIVGEIIGFWATLDRLTLITNAYVRYDLDITTHDRQLTFTPAGGRVFGDAGPFLQVQSQVTPAHVVRRAVKCNADLAGNPD